MFGESTTVLSQPKIVKKTGKKPMDFTTLSDLLKVALSQKVFTLADISKNGCQISPLNIFSLER
jgi:hypothetical protein